MKPRVPIARMAVYAADNAIWLYDVKTDVVTQIAQGEGLSLAKLVSKTEVSFLQDMGAGTTLRLFNIKTQEVRDLFTVATGINTYGWSPDGQTVAYITTDAQAYPHLNFRSLVGEGATQTVATLALALGRGTTVLDQIKLQYSLDGGHVLVVYTPADGQEGQAVGAEQSQLQIRGQDGSLAYAVDQDREPTMAAWAPDGTRAYYRTGKNVRAWVAASGRSETVRGAGAWFDPWVSPDGALIAYDTGATTTSVGVRVLNLSKRTVAKLTGSGFFHPVFAHPKTVWVQRVQRCEPDCLDPVIPGPEVFAVNVVTGAQRKLALVTLIDVDVLYY